MFSGCFVAGGEVGEHTGGRRFGTLLEEKKKQIEPKIYLGGFLVLLLPNKLPQR